MGRHPAGPGVGQPRALRRRLRVPPHIHDITYRAVVLQGQIHNDDPAAERMWMGPGSFWTQPAGEVHITAARGEDPLIFLEILSGPHLVESSEEPFDEGERPVNIVADNVVWLDVDSSAWLDGDGLSIAHLWGSLDGTNGSFLRLPAGAWAALETAAPSLGAVVVQGTVERRSADPAELKPGSAFASRGAAKHALGCASDAACLLYLRTEGR